MPVIKMRAPRSGANLMIFSGRITAAELLGKFGEIDEHEDQSSNNWLILDLGSAELPDVDYDTMTRLKALLAPKMAVMKARRAFDVCIVGLKPLNDTIYMSWKSLVTSDKDYPSKPLLISDLKSACEHLGYEAAERAELAELCAAVR
jgi:hypothetical protein